MIHHDCKSNAFSTELIMQLGDGCHKTRMLDLGKKFINLGMLSKRLPFFIKDGEHLLQRIKKLAEWKCMLALVVKGCLDMLGTGKTMSQVAFASIMVMQGEHVTMTILMTCDGTNPILCEFTLEISSQKGVNAMRIGSIVLTSEQSTSSYLPSEGKVLCSVFRFFFFVNNICQRVSIDARDHRKVISKSLAPLGPLVLILEHAGIGHLGIHID